MLDYSLEHICSYTATLGPPELIGEAAEGIRVIFYSTGGEVSGPRLTGTVRQVGGDWMTVRRDGVALMDVRTTIETHEGALILITYSGIVDLGDGGYERFRKGDIPATAKLRTAPRFTTGHPQFRLAESPAVHRHRRVQRGEEPRRLRRLRGQVTFTVTDCDRRELRTATCGRVAVSAPLTSRIT